MVKKSCYLCAKRNDERTLFEDIGLAIVPASQKPIKVVLQHLANCIKQKLDFKEGACICLNCLRELSEYDDLMLKLLTFQKKLTKLLEDSLSTAKCVKRLSKEIVLDKIPTQQKIKGEIIDIEDGLDDMDHSIFEGENTDASLEDSEDDVEDDNDDNGDNSERSKMWSRKMHECAICEKVFKSKVRLDEHMFQNHDASPQSFSCRICGAVRKDEEYLELHMNLHEGKTENQCRYCPKRFTRPVNTLRHMRKHWNKKKYQCEKCGVCFAQDNLLYNHKMKHDAEENPLICSICNQSFKTRKTYKHHMQTHEENRRRHQCPHCSKSFTERYTMRMHMRTTHGTDIETEIAVVAETDAAVEVIVASCQSEIDIETPCVICGVKFENKQSLDEHLEKEHDVILK